MKSACSHFQIVGLMNDKKDTDMAGSPNLDTHLVQNDTYFYSIQADVNFSSAGATVIPKGRVVLRGFSVICVRAGV
jgi:hypothetical protein